MGLVQDELQRHRRLKKNKARWHDYWQELADVLLPRRANIIDQNEPGERRNDMIYDGAPMQAARSLASAIDGLLKPKTSQWFNIRTQDEELNEDPEVKRWIEDTEQRMWTAIYSRDARFIQRTGEVDADLVVFGTAALFIGEKSDLGGLLFKTIHPKMIALAENADGVVDTVYYEFKLTARQAKQKFGDEVGKKIEEALRSESTSEKEFCFVQVVRPREEREFQSLKNTDFPFASITIDVESEKIVEETGFQEFPFAIPRWETSTGEVYGRSPGMIALPDANTLQAMGKTLLVAGQKAVDPPLWMLDDGVIGVPRTFPGGVTIVDVEAARAVNGQPFGAMDFRANIPLGVEMQDRVRSQVEGAFFRNVFNLPVDGPQMTATEVLERKEQFIREIGPVFGRLEADYIGHIIERVFGIMLRAGAFLEPPEALQGREVKFTFQSPIQQAKKQIEAVGAARSLELLAPFVEFQPEMMDNFNGDEIVRSTPDSFGIPMNWLRGQDEVEQLRQARAQARQAQQALDAGQQASEIASNVGNG